MKAHIAILPGDGIGPEVTDAARRVLEQVATVAGHDFDFETSAVGGEAIDRFDTPLPEATVKSCTRADAILLGAVGGPRWSDPSAPERRRPEAGLLELRRTFGFFANLRPVKVLPALRDATPLRPDRIDGVDLLIVRELTGGLYFGPRREEGEDPRQPKAAWDTMFYREEEVERVARIAFEAARGRRHKVASIDKANVLASMRLWRRVVDRVAADFPDVEHQHVLVDAAAMHLITRPADFDVVLAGNLFGDILSDEASVLAGSLGLLPSASLSATGKGLYEPVHGSAPDIAGQGAANPVGAILSAAMLLRHSLGLEQEAAAVETAVEEALGTARTRDLAAVTNGDDRIRIVDTEAMTEEILSQPSLGRRTTAGVGAV
ncbi:MAG: 3-isopropylmalate dehydrogenase [Thermoanaerobaculia bacterium]|nr:3-isopropylmalate dehydrogenase [Thermoanaerobaculia bacterium]